MLLWHTVLPANILNKTFIRDIKISFNIRNAGVWAPGWVFGDPEDETRAQRIFSFGLNMTCKCLMVFAKNSYYENIEKNINDPGYYSYNTPGRILQ